MKEKLLRKDGTRANRKDPLRMVWYGHCGYWTDDWDKLKMAILNPKNPHGIPVCPVCKAPGYESTFKDWMDAATSYQSHDHPRYVNYINYIKENCLKGQTMLQGYEEFLQQYPNGNPPRRKG